MPRNWRVLPTCMRASARLLLALVIVAVGALGMPADSSSHYRSAKKGWYFYGTLYHDRALVEDRSQNDPMSLIFGGGQWKGSGQPACGFGYDASPGCITTQITTHWEGMERMPRVCNSNAYVVYRDGSGRREFTSRDNGLSTSRTCGRQFHIRLYSDHVHADLNPHHGRDNRWTLAGVHRERKGDHRIIMDWDDARVITVKRMSRRACNIRHWHVHPGAAGKYQNFKTSGMMSQIALSQKSDGCKGSRL
jgi:hypothetical protein